MAEVSIIIPTYNDADTLSSAIDGVRRQTYSDWELLIVDDASPDNTEQVVNSINDDRIRYLAHESNKGAAAARNTGIKRARGRYIALLDSDDVWKGQKLERQISELEQRGPDWGAIYCGVEVDDGKLQTLKSKVNSLLSNGTQRVQEGGEDLVPDVFLMNLVGNWGSTLLVEKSVVDDIDGFDESFVRHQDIEFVIRVLRETKMAYLKENLAIIDKSGLAKPEVKEKGRESLFKKFDEEIDELERNGYPVRKVHNLSLGKRYLAFGQFRTGGEYIFKSHISSVTDILGITWACGLGLRHSLHSYVR